jgi:predicted dehydrogenase
LTRRVRLGQVGVGPWGRNVARNLGQLGDLVWLCDVKEEYGGHAAEEHPDARWTSDFDDLLGDAELEAVAIATDVPTHYPLAKRALEAGKHVFVEKPPAMRGDEMDELVAMADDRDLVLMPGHLLLYHPGVVALKELVDSGSLGDVFYLYGQRVNFGVIRPFENALWSLGVHDLSVILYLLDEEPSAVDAHGQAFLQPGVEDVVFCTLLFPSGKIAHMHLSWLDPHKLRKMTVVGSRQQVVFDDMEPEWKLTVYENAPQRVEAGWTASPGEVSRPAVALEEPLRLECEHFLGLVRGDGGGDRRRVAEDGARVVRALERLTECLRDA